MLKRKITAKLEAWKTIAREKALLIVGARQVGKSFAIRKFGKANYARYIEINLFEDKRAREALSAASDANDFISRVRCSLVRLSCSVTRLCSLTRSRKLPTL